MPIVEVLGLLLDGMAAWRSRALEPSATVQLRHAAIDSVYHAALATKAYIHDRDTTGSVDRLREVSLSEKWQQAASRIREYDQQLFNIARLKALGWADPNAWSELPIDPATLKLDLILEQCQWLRQHSRAKA
jgi:hypothetical protein